MVFLKEALATGAKIEPLQPTPFSTLDILGLTTIVMGDQHESILVMKSIEEHVHNSTYNLSSIMSEHFNSISSTCRGTTIATTDGDSNFDWVSIMKDGDFVSFEGGRGHSTCPNFPRL